MERGEHFNRFDFNDDRIRHYEIKPVASVNLHTAVNQGHNELALKCNAPRTQLVRQAVLVGRLKQARAERLVNRQARIHDNRCGGLNFRGRRFARWTGARFQRLAASGRLLDLGVFQLHRGGAAEDGDGDAQARAFLVDLLH